MTESYLREKEKYKIIVDDKDDRWELFGILGCITGTYRQMLREKTYPSISKEYIEAWLTEDEILMLKLRSSIKFEFYRMGL
jgi:hypothetical protein